MRHCSECGQAVELRVPAGDNRPRHVCSVCATVHYQNPRLIVGCIPQWEDRILLCRRAIEPAYGRWTLPAGFLELGEGTAEGAAREAAEEACIDVDIGAALQPHRRAAHRPGAHAVPGGPARTALGGGRRKPGSRPVCRDDIPWPELSFRSVRETLRHYFDDRRQGRFELHTAVLGPPPG